MCTSFARDLNWGVQPSKDNTDVKLRRDQVLNTPWGSLKLFEGHLLPSSVSRCAAAVAPDTLHQRNRREWIPMWLQTERLVASGTQGTEEVTRWHPSSSHGIMDMTVNRN